MATEETFYHGPSVKVTSARFVVGTKTFAIRGITSVDTEKKPPPRVLLALASLFLLGMSLGLFPERQDAGVAVVFGGALAMLAAVAMRPAYCVVLRTAGGEVNAYSHKDWSIISDIVDALGEAIVFQSQAPEEPPLEAELVQ